MSTFAVLFIIFFASAFLVLATIVLIVSPSVFRALHRSVRLIIARRHRNMRLAFNADKLNEDALDLEGLYYFESR